MNTTTRKSLLYSLVFILIVCKLFYWFLVFPNPDEAYYWHWGQYPALSYHDHPALQALTQGLFYKLLGKSLFVLRLPAFLCSIICGYIVFLFAKKLNFNNKKLHIVLFFSSPLFFLFTNFAWNDYMLITNCLLSGYFTVNFLHDKWINKNGRTKDIFLASFFLGLAILSKYNAVFLALGIFSVISFNKKLHTIYKDYRFYIALIISALVSSPIAIWNLQNKFGSFEFNIQQRTLKPFLELQFFKGNYIGFLIGSLIMLSPFVWWGIIKFWKISHSQNKSYTFVYQKFAKHIFGVSSISFLFLSLFSNVLYYWNIVAFIFIIPLANEIILNRKKAIASLIFSSVLIGGAVFHFGVIPFTAIFGGDDKDSTYHYGWKTIKTEITNKQKEQPDALLVTSSYRKASLLAFALNNKYVFSFSSRFDQFDYWVKNIPLKNGQKAIILTDDREKINNDLQQMITNISRTDTLKIKRFGYPIKEYYINTGIIIPN